MAENIPPSTAPTDGTRGLPYYEKLKRDLRDTLQKKRALDKQLSQLEDEIYRYEGAYLEETVAGNIIKGFDNYIKGSTAAGGASATGGGGGGTSTRRKGQVMDADRIFSRSSVSFMRELSPTSSAQTTPSHAATPTSGLPNPPLSARESNHATPTSSTSIRATSNFKKGTKRSDKEDEENEGKGPKRLKITYARAGVNE